MAQTETQAAETSADTQTQTQTDPGGSGTPRQKKGIGGCLLKLSLLLMLLIGGVGVAYVLSRNNSNEKFNDYIESTVASGIPLKVDDVVERNFGLPQGALDTTAEWETVIASFGSDEYFEETRDIPFLGIDVKPRWPPGEWSEVSIAGRFVNARRRELLELQLATAGYALFAPDVDQEIPKSTTVALDRAWDFLELSCYIAAHERDLDAVVTRLIACLNFGKYYARHPGMVVRRLNVERRGLQILLVALGRMEISARDLETLRNAVEPMAAWQPVRAWWEYERAIRLLMYNDLEKFRQTSLFRYMQEDSKQSTFVDQIDVNMQYSPFSGEDAVAFLEKMKTVEDLLNGNPVDRSPEVDETLQTIWNTAPSGLKRYQQPTARFMVPSASELVQATGEVAALRNVVLAVLAADHYRSLNGRFPQSLEDAIEDFLLDVPSDLHTSQPITLKTVDSMLHILSVGPNQTNDKLREDDIGTALPLEKWDASLDGVRKIK